jgi:hypothetical protein
MAEPYTPFGYSMPPIDYNRQPRGRYYGGQPGVSAGSMGEFSPVTEALGSMVPLGFAGPTLERGERFLRAIPPLVGEMTGVPAAGRAGEALAAGDYPQAAGQALMAAPSRLTAIPGMLLSEAGAQTPDPRQKRIKELDKQIAEREATIKGYADKIFKTKQGRADATKIEQDAIGRATAERTKLQDDINAEIKAAEDMRVAGERAAGWRNTPTATAYPGVQYGSAGLGAMGSAYLAFRGARRPVMQFNDRVRSIVDRQRAAIDQANDASLPAAVRNQARRTAQQAETDYQTAIAAQPHLTLRDRLTVGGLSGAATDLGMMAPTIADYIYSFQEPEGSLHGYSESQLNPLNNPGRFGVGGLTGAFSGMLGQEVGEQFPGARIPPSHGTEATALPSRYQSPRKPSKPRARK